MTSPKEFGSLPAAQSMNSDKGNKEKSKKNELKQENKKLQPPPGMGMKKPAKKDESEMTPEEKKQLKEARRKLQEEQRAAKSAAKGSSQGGSTSSIGSSQAKSSTSNQTQQQSQTNANVVGLKAPQRHQSMAKLNKAVSRTEATRKVPLFLHLKQFEEEDSLTKKIPFAPGQIVHRSIITLGLRYAEGIIKGADARAIAMLTAFSDVVREFTTPAGYVFFFFFLKMN